MAGSLDAFNGATTANDAQKAALSGMIAQMGSQGAAGYKAEQAVQQEAAKNAAASVGQLGPSLGPALTGATAASPGLAAALGKLATGPNDLNAQLAGQQATDFSQYAGLIGKANDAYGNAIDQAMPVVQSVTARAVAQIAADRQRQAQAAADAHQAAIDNHNAQVYGQQQDQKDRADAAKASLTAAGMIFKGGASDVPLPVEKAADTLGWNGKTLSRVTSSEMYTTLVDQARQALSAAPDMSYEELKGLLTQQYNGAAAKDPTLAEIGAVPLILRQFAGVLKHPYDTNPASKGSAAAPKAIARPNDLPSNETNADIPAAQAQTQLDLLSPPKIDYSGSYGSGAKDDQAEAEYQARRQALLRLLAQYRTTEARRETGSKVGRRTKAQ